MTDKNIPVAYCLGAYGVKGWVRLSPLGSGEALVNAKTWRIQKRIGEEMLFSVESIREHGTGLVAKLNGIDTKEMADAWKGVVHVSREDFPTAGKGEYWAVDLIGCMVRNREGVELGNVLRLESNGAHEILCVGKEAPEFRIPLVKNYIDRIAPDEKFILVDWQPDWK